MVRRKASPMFGDPEARPGKLSAVASRLITSAWRAREAGTD